MKRIAVAFSVIIVAFLLVAPAANANLRPAQEKAVEVLKMPDYLEYRHQGIVSKFLREGEQFEISMHLYAGAEYLFVAAGCEDAFDVDITILNSDGAILDYDDDYSELAIMKFVAPYSGKYIIQTSLANGKDNGSHVSFIAGYK